MSVAVTYPGVYIQEIPSGLRTITGVATSITAFLGRCPMGPIDRPEIIFSFGDFQERYGGLSYDFPLSYAVQDFFMNGGSQAVICRLYEAATARTGSTSSKAAVAPGTSTLTLSAPPVPVGWVVGADTAKGASKITIAKGQANPQPNDTFTLSDSTYTIIAFDPATSTALVNPSVVAAPPSSTDIELQFQGPPDPAPTGWKLTGSPAAGSTKLTIGAGTDAPKPGQTFALGGTTYTVVAFEPDKKIVTVKPPVPAVSADSPLAFQPTGWTLEEQPAASATTLTIKDGNGDPQPNQTFTLAGTNYTVVSFDATKNKLTVTPAAPAKTDALTANAPLTFPATPSGTSLQLEAASPGKWGDGISAVVDSHGLSGRLGDIAAAQYAAYKLTAADLFNLTVACKKTDGTIAVERFTNVTVKSGDDAAKAPNRLDRVLKRQSNLVRVPALANDPNGAPDLPEAAPGSGFMGQASGGDDGMPLSILTYLGNQDAQTGMFLLDKIDLFNLMCIPSDTRVPPYDIDTFVLQQAAVYCTQRRAMLIVDPPSTWADDAKQGNWSAFDPSTVGITGEVNGTETARNAAIYFPRVIKEDPVLNGHKDVFGACGIIAGVMASTDAARGVWKAPAGLDAGIAGIHSLQVKLTDQQNGLLNPLGINCLRTFPVIGPVVWGARTLRGADVLEDDYKYVPIRRLTLFIEESLYRGTKWAVFEPNDETLWSSLRLAVSDFLSDLARQGAFYTFAVTCDGTTTTARDIELGVVNILVQIAPVVPAEFVVIQIQQIAGQQRQS